MNLLRFVSVFVALCLTSAPELAFKFHAHDCCAETRQTDHCPTCYLLSVGRTAVLYEAITLLPDPEPVEHVALPAIAAADLGKRHSPAIPRGPPSA